MIKHEHKRVNKAATAGIEARILDSLIKKIPGFITPDILTILSFASAIGIAFSYLISPVWSSALLLAFILYSFNWFGDSLDGRLARFRKISRPRYGHYVDHILDSVSVAIILGALTTSTITNTSAWFWALAGFLLIMLHTVLLASFTGTFHLSIGLIGPTETRIIGAGITLYLFFFGDPYLFSVYDIFARKMINISLLDFIGYSVSVALWIVLFWKLIRTARFLDKEDRGKIRKSNRIVS